VVFVLLDLLHCIVVTIVFQTGRMARQGGEDVANMGVAWYIA
jgi:hypothetical protein